jgi:PTH1 family peptidyl-tRNA hydrolase
MFVVGLGNPGPEYERTRHNAGFLVLEAARRRWRGSGWRGQALYEESELRLAGRVHRLIRPTTYMNRCGDAVERLLRIGAAADDLLVVLDDLDLPLGRIRIRPHGGAGGHNGLQSVLAAVSPASVARMRVGVGRPIVADGAVDHVLGDFAPEEWARFEQVVERALEALQVALRRGITPAMNQFNGLPAPWEEGPAGPGGNARSAATEA